MKSRFVSIWFRHLSTDWFSISQPHLHQQPFVLSAPSHGRIIITGVNAIAHAQGITRGMPVADARAILPTLTVLDDEPEVHEKLLRQHAEWCIRFTPIVAIDFPNGLLLDATGCSHLWGGDQPYLTEITNRLNSLGYEVQSAIADTVGAAWAVARFANEPRVVDQGKHAEALMSLPPESLRLEVGTVDRLHKLGLHRISQFITIPRTSLRRRFGPHFLLRLDMAMGREAELIAAVEPLEPYQERLPSLEPILTAIGIAIALERLLLRLCERLQHEQKGLRTAVFKCYRVDGKVKSLMIGTNRPSRNSRHLFKLFDVKLNTIEPALGIELFVLEASKVEDHFPEQEQLWDGPGGFEDERVSELIDRLTSRVGPQAVHRYLPDQHYWPERSMKLAISLDEQSTTSWPTDRLRPVQLLKAPERIQVSAPIPDYPPMLFIYKDKIHTIRKADGPERIEQEWWLQEGQHRDYYRVEDELGQRYWIFRLGHYNDKSFQWFIHGFFA